MSGNGLRPAAVAGRFYEADPGQLRRSVDRYLASAGREPRRDVSAVVVPHAGHGYSGPVAAWAYRAVDPAGFDRVLLLGPAHFVFVAEIAASSATAWDGPLGSVPVDVEAVSQLTGEDLVAVDDDAHAPEHCLEVQLPFLQTVLLPGWTLVPLLVGHAPPPAVADVIDRILTDATLLVVSTDLSHYLSYDAARATDEATAQHVVGGEPDAIDERDACGAYALRGALHWVRRHNLSVELLDLRNSGDTAGPRDRVVGYGAFAVHA